MLRNRLKLWVEAMTGVLLLTAGGLIYVLYRSEKTLLLQMASALGMDGEIGHWRQTAAMLTPPEWVVYSLPAGLWALSYVLIIDSLTQGQPRRGRALAIGFVPMAGVASELMQAARILPGTFDWIDLELYVLPLIWAYGQSQGLFLQKKMETKQ